ncbi:hypothetical protein C8Q77DRAFT_1157427 [Trametes polyzona]|nr:hypothetical protein C8Q77DRAFT_1157427 [Trametes polyzona]
MSSSYRSLSRHPSSRAETTTIHAQGAHVHGDIPGSSSTVIATAPTAPGSSRASGERMGPSANAASMGVDVVQAARSLLSILEANTGINTGIAAQAGPNVDEQVNAVKNAVAAALAVGGAVPHVYGHPNYVQASPGMLDHTGPMHAEGGGAGDGCPTVRSAGGIAAGQGSSGGVPDDQIDPSLWSDVPHREEGGMSPAPPEEEAAARYHQHDQSQSTDPETQEASDTEHDLEGSLLSLPPAHRVAVKRLVKLEAQRAVTEALGEIRRDRSPLFQQHQHQRPRVPNVLQRVVRAVMHELIGLEDTSSVGCRRRRRQALPDAATRAQEGTQPSTPLFTPAWGKRVDEHENVAYITAVRELIREKGVLIYGLPPELAQDDGLVVRAAHTHFQTLRRQYIADHNVQAGMKMDDKKHSDKHKGRRRRKARRLRDGIRPFRRVFGKAATEGVAELIQSEDQSSEASSDGEAIPSERAEMRDAVGAGSTALEVRYTRWRRRQMTVISLALAVFARFQAERAHSGVIDTSSEDFSPEEREAYLTQLRRAVEKWPTILQGRDLQYNRFRGPVENHQDLPRLSRRRQPLYKECISRKWAKESKEHAQIFEAAPHCPASFTVLGLEIPLDILPQLDREYAESLETESDEDDSGGEGWLEG